jgi:hypothetical protein
MMIKQILFCFGFLISSLCAEEATSLNGIWHDDHPVICLELKNILAGHATLLTKEALESKQPLVAHRISLDCSEGPDFFHVGYYCGGKILTRFGRSYSECIMPYLGEQKILFSNGESLTSKEWTVERYEGACFIVHHYFDFKIYSNHCSQFIIFF